MTAAAIDSFLQVGGTGTWHVAFTAEPRLRSSGARERIGYWTGLEDLVLSIGGVIHFFHAAGEALSFEPTPATIGTQVRRARVDMFGLSVQAQDIYRAYDPTQAPAAVYSVLISAAGLLIGWQLEHEGVLDSAPVSIGAGDASASLSIEIASQMMPGTRVIQAKKSHASISLRGGDTAFEFASLKGVEDDEWVET